MRVALISEHASPLAWLGGADSGGQNVYVGQIARHLGSRGHQVDVFTRMDDPELPEIVPLCEGVRVINVPAGPATPIRKEDLLRYMDEFAEFTCDFALKDGGYDIAHANFFMSALVASDMRRSLGVPYVVTFHALGRVRKLHQGSADTFPEERLAIEDAVVEEADCVIAECPQDVSDLVELYGADRRRMAMIPCGFDAGEFWPVDRLHARRILRWSTTEPVILQLGRMVPRKGVETVIRAIGWLRDRHRLHCRLAIVGGETRDPDPIATPEIGRLMDICREEHVESQVTFVGSRNRDELRTYYSAADIFVTTPWYEPFGITPLEAMACGLPVVGSAVGGLKMTVADGETGYLVPPRDPPALAASLARLLRNPGLRQQFGERGRRRAQRLFTWERVTASIERLYAEVVRGATNMPTYHDIGVMSAR
jgi:glycosyltransferase involved in cell wall biosynthesis